MILLPKLPTKLILLTITLSLISTLTIASYFYLNYNFVLNEELNIRLNDELRTINLIQGEQTQITFQTTITNHWLCNSECSIEFKRLDNNKIIDKQEFLVPTTTRTHFNYNITPTRQGEGQTLYHFQITCNNIQTNICITNEAKIVRDGIIAVNFNLNESGLDLREQKKQLLEELISNLNLKYQSINYLETHQIQTNTTNSMKNELNAYISMFNELNYLFKVQRLKEISTFEKNNESITKAQNLLSYSKSYNELLLKYNELNLTYLLDKSFFSNNKEQLYQNITLLKKSFKEYLEINQINETLIKIKEFEFKENQTQKKYFNLTTQSFCENRPCEFIQENICLQTQIFLELQNQTTFNETIFNELQNNNNTNITQITSVNQEIEEFLLQINNTCTQKELFSPQSFELLNTNLSNKKLNLTINNPISICCNNNNCQQCCNETICTKPKPLILLHGHSFQQRSSPEYSTDSFNLLKRELSNTKGYIKGPILRPGTSISRENINTLQKNPSPIIFKATYYSVTLFDELNYITSISKTENIDTYAIRLKEIIDQALIYTNEEQIDIIAHSMGGLVVRRYIQIFGDQHLNNIILIGTPNNGISDRIYNYCSLFGFNKECEDMRQNSLFMRNLNDPRNQLKTETINVIRATGCFMPEGDGDGIATANSVYMPNQINFEITGECTTTAGLHSQILNPTKYPKTLKIIKEILN